MRANEIAPGQSSRPQSTLSDDIAQQQTEATQQTASPHGILQTPRPKTASIVEIETADIAPQVPQQTTPRPDTSEATVNHPLTPLVGRCRSTLSDPP